MGSKKQPKQVAFTPSTSAKPSALAHVHAANQSSILRSCFAPPSFNVHLFASVVQGFDSQHIRLHDTSSNRLRCEHIVTPGTEIQCLDWGFYGNQTKDQQYSKSARKRKRSNQSTDVIESAPDVVLAFGTSQSEIQIYSTTESKIVGILKDAHSGGIRDFKFSSNGHRDQAYSIGGDGKVVQWDLRTCTAMMTMVIPNGPATALLPIGSKVICASFSAHIMDSRSKKWSSPYNASTNNVHKILVNSLPLNDQIQFMSIAEADHFVNIFDEDSSVLKGSLRTENDVLAADLWASTASVNGLEKDVPLPSTNPTQVLVILNTDGILEIFPEPFHFAADSSRKGSESLKNRMQQRSRKSVAQVKIVRPNANATQVRLIGMSLQRNDIAVAWVENGIDVIFDTVRWRDEDTGSFLLKNSVEVIKGEKGTGIGAVSMNGVKDMGMNHVDDSHAVVTDAVDAGDVSIDESEHGIIDISSAEEEDDDESDGDEAILKAKALQGDMDHRPNHEVGSDDNADIEDESMPDVGPSEEVEPPSFGELLRANAPDSINVADLVTDGNTQSLVPVKSKSLQSLPSGMSLGTILTQSLRTNDTNLLETCLHTKDLSTVRATIERLDSSLAINLLQRLAERLHSRPGRAGSLMVWIQWILVAHGGYLAGQPEVMRKLNSLHKVVKQRAGSLQSLLSLKGKLDMLEAQMNLRRSVLEKSRGANADEDDEEEGVIYVEGQDEAEEDTSDDEASSSDGESKLTNAKRGKGVTEDQDEGEGEDEDEDDIPLAINGVSADAESASQSDEDDMAQGEASETENDSEEELDDEDIDHASADTDSSDGEEALPLPTKVNGSRSISTKSQKR